MKTETLSVKMRFTEPLLGCASGNKEIHRDFIASQAPTVEAAEEEITSIPEMAEKTMTIFPRDEKGLHLWDYQIKGFFKENLAVLVELGDCALSKWIVKKAVNALVFVEPRRIYLHAQDGSIWQKSESSIQRPLRAETLQGDRIALASSEMLPVGTWIEFRVDLLSGSNAKSKLAVVTLDDLRGCLQYASRKGFLQWRSGGWGRFEWEEKA